mmetsp:Transcript_11143/g.13177  ORF Transcript_11143/g.13177 Transcript_11143/m.13177 type:complete len:80 (+) Transcript_11143:30-269(+)
MIHPKTPQGAAFIFLVGCGVVAITSYDVHKKMQLNSQPVTEEQIQALNSFKKDLERKHNVSVLESFGGSNGTGSGITKE